MPITIPEELRTVHVVGAQRDLWSLTSQITTADRWTETHVSGGGGHSIRGTGHVAPVQSHVTQKDRVFAVDEAGNEHAWTFVDSSLDAKPGHAITFISFTAKTGTSPFVAAYNHNLRTRVVFTQVLAKQMQVRRLWLLPGWAFALIAPLAVAEGTGPLAAIAVGLAPLLSMFGIKRQRMRGFDAHFARVAAAVAGQEPKFPAVHA